MRKKEGLEVCGTAGTTPKDLLAVYPLAGTVQKASIGVTQWLYCHEIMATKTMERPPTNRG